MHSPIRAAGIWALLIASFVSGSALAQTPAPPTPAAPPPAPAAPSVSSLPISVLVVDVAALLQNSKAAKMVRSQMESKQAEYRKDISAQEQTLRQQQADLQRQQAAMSRESMEQKGRDFQQKVGELDRNVQSKRQALERSNNEALEKVQEAMLKIIADIAKQRKVNLVFQRSELVLFDPGFDITDEVLRRLDDELPTLTVNFTSPAPAQGTTAAAAAGAPANQPAAAAKPPKKK